MELAVKAMTERLVEDCGGWLPLTMRAWRKYTRRKLEKKRPAPAPEPEEVVEAAPEPEEEPRVAWADADDSGGDGELYGEGYSEGKLDDDDDDALSFEVAPAPPRPKRRMSGLERDEAVAAAALLSRRRDASATYFLHQRQSETTRNRSGVERRHPERAPPSKRFAWLDQQGVPAAHAEHTAARALALFPALKCLEVATGVAQHLFLALDAAALVVEFYLSNDAPRTREPVVAVDP